MGSDQPLFPYLTPVSYPLPPRIWGCSPWTRLIVRGCQERRTYPNCACNCFRNFMTTIAVGQRNSQTTCRFWNGDTELCAASRGNETIIIAPSNRAALIKSIKYL